MPLDVATLLNEGEYIFAETAPSLRLFTGSETDDQTWVIFSLLSSRRVFWEAYVSLHGYAQATGQDARKILAGIHPGEVPGGLLEYCSQFSELSSSIDALRAAWYVFRLILADVPAMWRAASVEKLEECIKQYDHNWQAVWECMNK